MPVIIEGVNPLGAYELFELALDYNLHAKATADLAKRAEFYSQKYELLIAAKLMHGDKVHVSISDGSYAFWYDGNMMHIPAEDIERKIRNYPPEVRVVLAKMFRLKVQKTRNRQKEKARKRRRNSSSTFQSSVTVSASLFGADTWLSTAIFLTSIYH